MKHIISIKNMKATMHNALNKHNLKRKNADTMKDNHTPHLYHPKITQKSVSHIGTMLFSKTKLGIKFWKTAVNESLNSNQSIPTILEIQLKKISKTKGIPLETAKKQMVEDLIKSNERYQKLVQELNNLGKLNKSKLTRTTDDAYRNNAQIFSGFLYFALKHYKK